MKTVSRGTCICTPRSRTTTRNTSCHIDIQHSGMLTLGNRRYTKTRVQPCVNSSTLSAALRQQQSAADVTTLCRRCVTWQTSGSPSRKKQLASTISTGMRWKRTAGYASRIPVITVSTSTICRQRNGVTSRGQCMTSARVRIWLVAA